MTILMNRKKENNLEKIVIGVV